jgi:hypothetical protein
MKFNLACKDRARGNPGFRLSFQLDKRTLQYNHRQYRFDRYYLISGRYKKKKSNA